MVFLGYNQSHILVQGKYVNQSVALQKEPHFIILKAKIVFLWKFAKLSNNKLRKMSTPHLITKVVVIA